MMGFCVIFIIVSGKIVQLVFGNQAWLNANPVDISELSDFAQRSMIWMVLSAVVSFAISKKIVINVKSYEEIVSHVRNGELHALILIIYAAFGFLFQVLMQFLNNLSVKINDKANTIFICLDVIVFIHLCMYVYKKYMSKPKKD